MLFRPVTTCKMANTIFYRSKLIFSSVCRLHTFVLVFSRVLQRRRSKMLGLTTERASFACQSFYEVLKLKQAEADMQWKMDRENRKDGEEAKPAYSQNTFETFFNADWPRL